MEIVRCTDKDLTLLAQLNKELFEDEKNDNVLSENILAEKLKNAMDKDSAAYIFTDKGSIVGYALVRTQLTPYYLSHFYICREHRRKRLGTVAFDLLLAELGTDSIDLDVFCWNHRGQEFWKSLGFTERAIIMRRTNKI